MSEPAKSDPWRSLGLENEGARGFDVLGGWHAEVETQQDLDRHGGERQGVVEEQRRRGGEKIFRG